MSHININITAKQFPGEGEEPAKDILRNLNFTLADREFVCLFGPSGCGKTTVLNLIAGLDTDFTGHIELPGDDTRLGYVFQNPRLLPWLSVLENLTLVLDHLDDPEIAAKKMLTLVGLGHAMQMYPEKLSVGMARRVAIARAFAIEPDILLMDEPFVSLDRATAVRLRKLLIDVWHQRLTTILFVTHDLREALAMADRILFLSPSPTKVVRTYKVGIDRDLRSPDIIEGLYDEIGAKGDVEI